VANRPIARRLIGPELVALELVVLQIGQRLADRDQAVPPREVGTQRHRVQTVPSRAATVSVPSAAPQPEPMARGRRTPGAPSLPILVETPRAGVATHRGTVPVGPTIVLESARTAQVREVRARRTRRHDRIVAGTSRRDLIATMELAAAHLTPAQRANGRADRIRDRTTDRHGAPLLVLGLHARTATTAEIAMTVAGRVPPAEAHTPARVHLPIVVPGRIRVGIEARTVAMAVGSVRSARVPIAIGRNRPRGLNALCVPAREAKQDEQPILALSGLIGGPRKRVDRQSRR
jgi:hypothetical protein